MGPKHESSSDIIVNSEKPEGEPMTETKDLNPHRGSTKM